MTSRSAVVSCRPRPGAAAKILVTFLSSIMYPSRACILLASARSYGHRTHRTTTAAARPHAIPGRRALYRELRFIGRHVRGFWGAIAAFLTIGFGVGAAAGLVFAAFGRLVASGATQAFDERVLHLAAELRTPWLDEAMLEITSLGNAMVLFTMVAIAGVFLWLTRHHYSAALLVVAVVGGDLLNDLLKGFYARPRPAIVQWGTDVHSASFPSGHAMAAVVAYGSVAYLVARLEPTPTLRRATWAMAILIILAVGISRIYLGVHYPSDVAAGFVAGLAWTAFVAATITAIRFFAERKPEVEQAEHDLHIEERRARGLRSADRDAEDRHGQGRGSEARGRADRRGEDRGSDERPGRGDVA